MERPSGSDEPDPDRIAEWQARADAGDRDAAGRLGELLARRGDLEGALRVWAQAYGDSSSTTLRLAELLAERGDLKGAVNTWEFSDVVWQNPVGLQQEYLSTLSREDYLQETTGDPEDWAFMEAEKLNWLLAQQGDPAATEELRTRAEYSAGAAMRLARLLAQRGDQASITELRTRAEAGDQAATHWLAKLPTSEKGREDAV